MDVRRMRLVSEFRGEVDEDRVMACCDQLQELVDQEMLRVGPMHTLRDGRIINEVDTEYFLRFGAERPSYVGIHYCPFCGRVVSRGLWNLEKKKQGF